MASGDEFCFCDHYDFYYVKRYVTPGQTCYTQPTPSLRPPAHFTVTHQLSCRSTRVAAREATALRSGSLPRTCSSSGVPCTRRTPRARTAASNSCRR